MSSIIDALKKSDHNRTNEAGANINQIKFGHEPPPKSRRGFWLLVTLLLLVAFGVFAWTQGWHHIAINKTKNLLGMDPNQSLFAAENQIEPEKSNNPDQKTTDNTLKPKSRSNNKLTPPQADEIKAKSRANVEAETDNNRKQQLEVIASREASTDEQLSRDDQTKTDEADQDQADEIKALTAKAEMIAKQERKELEPSLKQDYLLIHQIDFEVRKNIPPIKLNIHIFDPEPENRMVILNGVKYATGDNIEEIVTVKEINREGVVLQFENIKFLIPK